MKPKCVRCGSTKKLEGDHVIPKSKGGTDDYSNKRVLCQGCHKYRHTRDGIISAINKELKRVGTLKFNASTLSMWIFRLGVLEAFNTPEKIRKRGTYIRYWDLPETHYSRWYPQIKLAAKQMKEAIGVVELTKFIETVGEPESCASR